MAPDQWLGAVGACGRRRGRARRRRAHPRAGVGGDRRCRLPDPICSRPTPPGPMTGTEGAAAPRPARLRLPVRSRRRERTRGLARATTIASRGTDATGAAAAKLGPIAVGVVTVSDSRTADDDTNGLWLHERIAAVGAHVSGYRVVRDEPDQGRAAVDALVADARIVVVNGGTGVRGATRPTTPWGGCSRRRCPGSASCSGCSLRAGRRGRDVLRATACTYRGSVVVSVPGSPKAVALAWEKLIEPELAHLAWEVGG